MIEIVPAGIQNLGESETALPEISSQVRVTLRGEIVDSRCYLGVMNPGRSKPHRPCAIQCLRGGIPLLLVVESRDGKFEHYVLVGLDGKSINDSILDYVAEPVEFSGELWDIGARRVLFVDLETVSRP